MNRNLIVATLAAMGVLLVVTLVSVACDAFGIKGAHNMIYPFMTGFLLSKVFFQMLEK